MYVTARREIDAGTSKVNPVGVEAEREASGEPDADEDAPDTRDVATGSFSIDPTAERPRLGSETPEPV